MLWEPPSLFMADIKSTIAYLPTELRQPECPYAPLFKLYLLLDPSPHLGPVYPWLAKVSLQADFVHTPSEKSLGTHLESKLYLLPAAASRPQAMKNLVHSSKRVLGYSFTHTGVFPQINSVYKLTHPQIFRPIISCAILSKLYAFPP